MYFFETVVRVHRAGEGAYFTGLKPAGLDVGPVIPVAEQAIDTGTPEELEKLLHDIVGRELKARFHRMQSLKAKADRSVEDAREYTHAMLGLQVWAHSIYEQALARPHEDSNEHHH
jgi:hypothetical protein